ncbi:hypothetical protein BJ170DRAFT_678352 [Xylariales sp. AK1849]|nr:hypothetical protein BJ170DRAFT_678352 [Xylariales sp. AK1849]
MATEQPQSILVNQKVPGLVIEDEKMAVDEPVTKGVNGHASSDDVRHQSEEAPIANGQKDSREASVEPTEDARNQQAFSTNSNISAKTPSKSAAEPLIPTDTELISVNGSKEEKSAVASGEATKREASDASALSTVDSTSFLKVKSVTPNAEPIPESAVDDSMDIDVSTEQPDLTSSVEHAAESTQDTSTVSDTAVVTSPQELSQSADVSKLDIKSPDAAPEDLPMSDRAATPAKVSRERDDDDVHEPSAKRARIEPESEQMETQPDKAEDSIGVATGLSPAPASSIFGFDDIPNDQVINTFQSKEIRKELARLKKTKNGMNFRGSVEKLWPVIWEEYKKRVEEPVDLSMFEVKFREEKYTTFGDFIADLRLVHKNSVAFNGPDHIVSTAAGHVTRDLLNKLKEVAKLQEPAKVEKGKSQPTRHAEPRAATQPRRSSQSQSRTIAASPKPKPEPAAATPAASTTPVTTSAPAFALPPNGVPQIRRDSTRDDGDRPKRPIHPPKNRDLDYSSKNARKKKLEPELKFFDDVLTDLKKPKYWAQNQWFSTPVDPVAFNIPTYFSVVKKPMDLKTMTEKLETGEYRNGKEVEKDMRQIVANSELFNGEGPITTSARDLETLFKQKLAEKDAWMARNYPPSAPSVTASAPSPEASDHESDEESEAEEAEEPEVIRNLQSRLGEEQEKVNTMMLAKKPDMTMLEIQQNVVQLLQRKLVEEKTKVGNAKKSKPKRKPTKSKSKAAATTAGTSKKSAGGSASASKKSAPASNKKSATKKRTIGLLEKQVVTEGIGELDGPTLDKAVDIIKKDTNQKEDDDGQLELDIEVLSHDALSKLFDLILRHYPQIYDNVAQRPEFSNGDEQPHQAKAKSSNAPKPKKNKPMNKHEQERNIEKLRELKAQFQRQGSGSQEPMAGEGEEQRLGDSSEEEESDSEEE